MQIYRFYFIPASFSAAFSGSTGLVVMLGLGKTDEMGFRKMPDGGEEYQQKDIRGNAPERVEDRL